MVLVLAMFFARWLVADVPSYWYDEFLSVDVYGRWNDSSTEAIRRLADSSAHPPLYQFLLYHWMSLFGGTELATRTLSNIYIGLATVFVYLTTQRIWGRHLGLAAAALFSVMYVPLYYALETRSYAQSIFLATLSSYAFLGVLALLDNRFELRRALTSGMPLLLFVSNLALFFTHYYNVFFLLAQAMFLGVYLLRNAYKRIPSVVGLALLLYGLPALAFLVSWGRVTIQHFGGQSDRLVEDIEDPIEIVHSSVITAHLDAPVGLAVIGLLLVIVVIARQLWRAAVAVPGEPGHKSAWATLYMLAWILVPPVIMYAAFLVVGSWRYNDRYFAFLAPPLAVLLVFIGYETVRWLGDRLSWRLPASAVGIVFGLALLLAVLPQSRDAVLERPFNWRGLATQVITIVESDPDHDYIIYKAGLRQIPLMNHYFERLHPDIRVHGTITSGEQNSDRSMRIERARDEIIEHDYLVIMFPHRPVDDYAPALERLEEEYVRHYSQLDDAGRGLLIFRTPDE